MNEPWGGMLVIIFIILGLNGNDMLLRGSVSLDRRARVGATLLLLAFAANSIIAVRFVFFK